MRIITAPLKETRLQEYSLVQEKRLDFPVDETERDTRIYQLLQETNINKIISIAQNSSSFKTDVNSMIDWFNSLITRKLIRSLKYKLEEINGKIKKNDDKDIIPQILLLVYFKQDINIGDNNTFEQSVVGQRGKIEQKKK